MPEEKSAAQDEEYVVRMKGITKVYPNGVAANQGVDFNLRRGEIHALMGENGAGKSTLMKMLFGLEQPTSGEIVIRGEKLSLTSPSVAIAHGIGMATYAKVPSQLIDIIQGVIFLFFAAEQFLSHYRQKLVVKSAQEELARKKLEEAREGGAANA